MDINQLLSQAMTMKNQLEEEQAQFEQKTFSKQSQGIRVVMKGNHAIESLEIDDELFALQDKALLQDILTSTINGLIEEIEQERQGKFGELGNMLGF